MKRYFLTLVCLFIFIFLTSIVSAETVTITDMAGRTVTAPLNPGRIVCIGPGTLRLIVYLQAEDRVVGVEDMEKANPGGRPYWVAHPELAKLPRCGAGGPAGINTKPDLETVLSLSPGVIFITYMEEGMADEVEKALNIPVVVLSYGEYATFDEAVFDAMRVAGKVLNLEDRAEAVISYINELRADLKNRSEGIPEEEKPRVYVGGIGYRGSFGIESTEQHYIPFDWVGGRNVAEQVSATSGSHVFMDKEMLLKLDPDVIFIDAAGLDLTKVDFQKKPAYYQALTAFSEERVYSLHPFNWYATNIGTALGDAYAIGKIVYPKKYADITPEKKADEIYSFLVGKPVYTQMEKNYGRIGQPMPLVRDLN